MTGRGALGAVSAVTASVLLAVTLSCELLLSEVEQVAPRITVGAVVLQRSVRDTQRYLISLSVLNHSEDTLESLEFHARVQAETAEETFLQGVVAVASTTSIAGTTRRTLEFVLESPFPVVPPTPLLMTEVRVGNPLFRRSDGSTYRNTGWVHWPWPVEEVR